VDTGRKNVQEYGKSMAESLFSHGNFFSLVFFGIMWDVTKIIIIMFCGAM